MYGGNLFIPGIRGIVTDKFVFDGTTSRAKHWVSGTSAHFNVNESLKSTYLVVILLFATVKETQS